MIQQFLERPRRCFHRLEAVSGRIQVEHHLIWNIELIRPAEPDVRSHTCLIGEIDQRGGVVADDVPDGASHLLYCDRLDPAGIMRWSILLEKAGLVDPVRVTFQDQRTASKMWQYPRGDAAVVIDQVLFSYAVLRKQHFPRTCNPHLVAADSDDLFWNDHRQPSRTTSFGLLSSRRPRNRGCRNLPLGVHSLKAISATSSGLTQCASRCGSPSTANGLVAVSSRLRYPLRRRNVAVSNPVPTFPTYTSFPRW